MNRETAIKLADSYCNINRLLNAIEQKADAREARNDAIKEAAEEIFSALQASGNFREGSVRIEESDLLTEIAEATENADIAADENNDFRAAFLNQCANAFHDACDRLSDAYACDLVKARREMEAQP